MNETATVPVKPPAASTINWVNLAGPAAALAAYFGLDIPADTLLKMVIGLQAAVSLFTVVRNTYFRNTVISTSMK